MKLNRKARMYEQMVKHGNELNVIFKTGLDPVSLCKKVHLREMAAHRLATDYCNGLFEFDELEILEEKALSSLDKILHFRNKHIPVFLNTDSRGYTFKISDKYMRSNKLNLFQDWGGYGIIAPEFTGE